MIAIGRKGLSSPGIAGVFFLRGCITFRQNSAMVRRIGLLLSLTLLQSSLMAADSPGYRVKYSGGSLNDFKTNDYLRLVIEQPNLKVGKGKTSIAIPIAAVTELSYGEEVRHRVLEAAALGVFTLGIGALVGFSKQKKHYIGVIWDQPENGNKGGIVLQAGKDNYRGILAALEGLTGKKAIDADAEAAKARAKDAAATPVKAQ